VNIYNHVDVYLSLGNKPDMHDNDAFMTPTKKKIDELNVRYFRLKMYIDNFVT
jgi:hypothetical protein